MKDDLSGRGRAPVAGALAALSLALASGAWAANGDLTVKAPAGDSEISVRTCSKFAGAVCSIEYRGKEHIDTKDHGRLLQSAAFFERYGECLNPTEGGSQRDRHSSTSVLKAAVAEKNRIRTTTDMAYWLRPGQDYSKGCGRRKDVKQALNKEARSGHLLDKQITVGLPRFANVIEHRVTYNVPRSYSFAVFEASTGYMPLEFSLALRIDPGTGAEIQKRQAGTPVILATRDRRHAMGVYAPNPPKGLRYGRFTYPDVVKWNCLFEKHDVEPGRHDYRCLIVLGTVDEVKDTIRRLHAENP